MNDPEPRRASTAMAPAGRAQSTGLEVEAVPAARLPELMLLVQQRDQAAFNELYDLTVARVFALARRMPRSSSATSTSVPGHRPRRTIRRARRFSAGCS
jgi:hypothetical protein